MTRKIDGYELLSVATVDNRGFNLPCTEPEEKDGITYGNSLTSDVKVRRAINLAIDREEMIENVLNGYGTVAYSVCDKMHGTTRRLLQSMTLMQRRHLMEEAGWIEGDEG